VNRTTVSNQLKALGEPRRGTQEGNQRRYPGVGRFCAMCGNAFTIRQGHLAHGAARAAGAATWDSSARIASARRIRSAGL
jgi:hypothetical protein